MTTTKTLGVCPRCQHTEYAEFEKSGPAFGYGLVAGLILALALAGAVLMVMNGVVG